MPLVASSLLSGATVASADVPVPAGAASGQIAVVAVTLWSGNTVTPPDGSWTLKSYIDPGTDFRFSIFWKRLTAADTGVWSFTWTGGSIYAEAEAGLWSDRAPVGDPWGDTSTNTTSATNVIVAPSVDALDGDDLVGFAHVFAAVDWSPPAGMTEDIDGDVSTMVHTDGLTVGATGTKTFTATASFEPSCDHRSAAA